MDAMKVAYKLALEDQVTQKSHHNLRFHGLLGENVGVLLYRIK